jgi:autotransporter passenger strand-loop-strand repeat protein/autotransporter-associated beta strand protein
MTHTVVSSGETSSGIVLNSGDTMDVLSGGTAIDTTVNSGGTLQLFDGATVDGVTINSGGLVNHLSGATTVSGGTIVNSGTIDAEAPSGSLLIEPDNFTNSDLIQVRNGDHVFIQPAVSFTNFNAGTLTGGTYDIGSASIIELGVNQFVTTLDATLILGGTGASLQSFDGASEIKIDQTLTTINSAGALFVQGDASFNFGDLTDAGILQLGGNTTVNSISIQGTRSVTLDPATGFFVEITSTISDEVGDGTGTGVGSLIVNGGGTVELDGANTYTGGTTVTDAGTTLVISDDTNLGDGGTLALGQGTTLELFFGGSAAYTITHSITLTGAVEFRADAGVSATIAGAIGGAGTLEVGNALAVGGGGMLVLGNAGNTYTGGTTIYLGTLEIATAHAAGTGGITFAPAVDPTLRIDAAAFPANTTFTNVIYGFAPGVDIDLAGVSFTAGETLSIDANNLLTVWSGGDFYSLQMAPSETFSGDIIYLAGDGSGTTDIIATTSLSAGAGQTVQAPIVFNGATLTVQSGGTAGNTVINGGTLDVQAGGIVSGGVTFSGTGGTYEIDGTTIPGATVSGVVSGDRFVLSGIGFDPSGHADLTGGNVLVISENGNTYDINLDPGQDFTGDFFHLQTNADAITIVTEDTTPCYCRGTLILTPAGEVPVEELKIGDEVVTVSGAARAIEWVGRRGYSGQFVLGRNDILPVRIKASALDDGIPRRDLWVSPNHAMYLEGVLIEAKDLVNGASITQAKQIELVEYFHLELASHDVILAEGAAAESFIEDDNRGLFHNAAEYWAMHPEPAAGPAQYCAPRREEGFEVERAWARIATRAGLAAPVETAPIGALRGHIDQIGRRITGWALDEACAEAPLCLDIYAGNELLGQVVANRYCAECAWIGDGRHGFEFVPPEGLAFAPGSVTVRRSRDGAALSPSSALARQVAGGTRQSARR